MNIKTVANRYINIPTKDNNGKGCKVQIAKDIKLKDHLQAHRLIRTQRNENDIQKNDSADFARK